MGQISEDLRNLYLENEYFSDGRKTLMPAALIGDYDSNGAGRLRFVMGGNADQVGVLPSDKLRKVTPSMLYGDFWEVAYVMDSDSKEHTLWRAVRYFDRRDVDHPGCCRTVLDRETRDHGYGIGLPWGDIGQCRHVD